MKLTPQLKMQIDNYFANISAEELYKVLTEKYNLKDLTENDERFTKLMQNVVTMFLYGSTVYGTLTDCSDTDIVVIVNDEIDLSEFTNGIWEYHVDNNDYQFINESRFIEMVKAHHIIALEMFSLPQSCILKGDVNKYKQYFTLDKWKMRQVISGIASNAYAKAHKKMTVEKDYDLYRGQKSLFHSVRVMIFGIQIAKYGKIVDYTEANKYWEMIKSLGECGWDKYKELFKPIINSIRSEFVALCPKPEEYIASRTKN